MIDCLNKGDNVERDINKVIMSGGFREQFNQSRNKLKAKERVSLVQRKR